MATPKLSKRVLKLIEEGNTVKAGDKFFEENKTGTITDIQLAKIANTIRYNDGIKTIKDAKKK